MVPGSAGSRSSAKAGAASVPKSIAKICQGSERQRNRAVAERVDQERNELRDRVHEMYVMNLRMLS